MQNMVGKSLGAAVITGASSGIGREYARQLAKRGYDLMLAARRADRLSVLAEEVRNESGVAVRTVVADLGDAKAVRSLADVIREDGSIRDARQ